MQDRGFHGHYQPTHGLSETPEYRLWARIRQRCENPHDPVFEHYGGRGICVCEKWRDNFLVFLADIGCRPSPRHSFDRYPNTNGNYEPGNVRWATTKQQIRNRRGTKTVEYQNRIMPLAEAAEIAGVPYWHAAQRLRRGWTVQRALETPVILRPLKDVPSCTIDNNLNVAAIGRQR